jgi:hypothetical protein
MLFGLLVGSLALGGCGGSTKDGGGHDGAGPAKDGFGKPLFTVHAGEEYLLTPYPEPFSSAWIERGRGEREREDRRNAPSVRAAQAVGGGVDTAFRLVQVELAQALQERRVGDAEQLSGGHAFAASVLQDATYVGLFHRFERGWHAVAGGVDLEEASCRWRHAPAAVAEFQIFAGQQRALGRADGALDEGA